jgi:pyruvate formate lyase activating enzyme
LGSAVERVEVLPFHKMGEAKWASSGLTYTLQDTPAPTSEQVDKARMIFRGVGLEVF